MRSLHATGYSPSDIIGTVFKVCKTSDLPEALKLKFMRDVGFAHVRIGEERGKRSVGLARRAKPDEVEVAAFMFLCAYERADQLKQTHVAAEGNATLLQLLGLVGKLAEAGRKAGGNEGAQTQMQVE